MSKANLKEDFKEKILEKKKEVKIHFSKYLVDNEKKIEKIFIPMLKVVFGSEMNTKEEWEKKIKKELTRKVS